MNTYTTCEARRALLDSANGRIFSATFLKKDGSVREIVAKKWIESAFSQGSANAGKNPVAHKSEYYTCAELSSGSFKNLNLNTLISAKIDGNVYTF